MGSFTPTRLARVAIVTARILATLALLALIGAWVNRVTGEPVLGMGQQHLYNDAIVLALLGIGSMLDAMWHSKGRM